MKKNCFICFYRNVLHAACYGLSVYVSHARCHVARSLKRIVNGMFSTHWTFDHTAYLLNAENPSIVHKIINKLVFGYRNRGPQKTPAGKQSMPNCVVCSSDAKRHQTQYQCSLCKVALCPFPSCMMRFNTVLLSPWKKPCRNIPNYHKTAEQAVANPWGAPCGNISGEFPRRKKSAIQH